jgi:carbonic anhydrase
VEYTLTGLESRVTFFTNYHSPLTNHNDALHCAPMTAIDEVLAANEIYSRTHELRSLTPRPARKLAVLTCMDTRLSIRTLGLQEGDAHIIRNAGGIVTDDSLRSLLISHYLLGTEEIMVINHTDCGLMHATEDELRTRIQNRTGTAAVAPAFFYAFQNIEENVRHQLQKLRTHPWIPESVAVRGFVYDVTSGRLREIALS